MFRYSFFTVLNRFWSCHLSQFCCSTVLLFFIFFLANLFEYNLTDKFCIRQIVKIHIKHKICEISSFLMKTANYPADKVCFLESKRKSTGNANYVLKITVSPRIQNAILRDYIGRIVHLFLST